MQRILPLWPFAVQPQNPPQDRTTAAAGQLQLSCRKPASEEESNFGLKALVGTQVRTCYGCGKPLRVLPHVPEPPHDLCIVQVGRRVYKSSDGCTRVSADPQNCHYHMYQACIKRKLQIPEQLKNELLPIH